MLKSSEVELARKRDYYLKNKEKILNRKHERQSEIYANKVARAATDEKEYEKEMMRKFSKLDNEKTTTCEVCGAKEEDLGYFLEGHHFDYNDTTVSFLCKPCHAEADKYRRRQ